MRMNRAAAGCFDFRRSGRCTRREALEAGWLGALGLSMAGLWASRGVGESTDLDLGPGFGKARRCILMFMWGGPSHLDTWDLKPDAPSEIRGEFNPIATATPGIQISEHFPRLAKWSHRYALLRSLTHDDPAHLSSAHHILTGHYAPRRNSDADPPSRKDSPHLGSVIAKVRPAVGALPAFVTLPWIVSHPAAPGGRAPGQNAGWLGSAFDPMTIADPSQPTFRPGGLNLPADVAGPRLHDRQSLLHHVDESSAHWKPVNVDWTTLSDKAFDLLVSPAAQKAFNIAAEPATVRERYGLNTHGQSILLARRLIEAGVPLVTVNWHDDHQNFWDTHGDNFNQLKKRLMPAADQGFSALLEDLDARGMLDDTLLVWVGEFGRKPQITRNNAGREHWPRCFSAALAGGGVAGGQVYGASDRIGAYPAEKPTSPSDIAATMYHALGVSADTRLRDPQGAFKKLVSGRAITEIF